jgi:hypothetical protein
MKLTTLIPAIIAAGCAAASIYLGMELSGAREELAQQIEGRSADQARIRQLEGERRQFDTASSTVSQLSAADPEDAPAPPAPSSAAPRMADGMNPPGGMPGGPRGDRPGDNLSTPAARANRRIQQEISLRRTYAEMPAALGLDAAQADKLFDLLADNRMATLEDQRGYRGDPIARDAIEAAAREQRDAQIDALLGPDKAADFHYFEKSIPARMQVNRIGESMTAANVPLTDAQRKSMIAVVYSEQQAKPAPERSTITDPTYQARFLDWQADYSKRVQARVEPLLSADQLARYREAVEVQNARRADMQAREARRNSGRQ